MLQNDAVKDGFRRKPYPKRKGRPPLTYQHVNDSAGRVFLIVTTLTGEQLVGGHMNGVNMTRRFKEAGITQQKVYDTVVRLLPEYPAYYEQMAGRPLTPYIVMQRFRMKSTYTNGKPGNGGRPSQSREHFTYSKKLRPYVTTVEQVFRTGVPLTLEQMKELGT